MICWQVCHQSGRVLFTTNNEVTARNREQFGWKVIKVDKSREQFEEWFSDHGKHQYAIEKSNGNYILASANSAWQSWQASRAVIEIELPPAVDGSNVPFAGNAWNAYRSEAIESIRAAGIKVKE